MRLNRWAVLGLCSALLGCPSVTPPGVLAIRSDGPWEHPASGLRFPEQVASYQRVVINQYDAAGTNVGVGYNYESLAASVAFTVYVRPPLTLESGATASLAEQFDIERQVIHAHHAGGDEAWVHEASAVTERGSVPAKAAEYRYDQEFSDGRRPVVSQLYLFDRDGWFVKYRVTFAKAQEERARVLVEAMLSSAPWGAIGSAP
jgi:hypothetical protein